MASTPIAMSTLKQIIRLKQQGKSLKQIVRICQSSKVINLAGKSYRLNNRKTIFES